IAFTIARQAGHIPEPLERVIIFPMAVVPNLWGFWNMVRIASGAADRWPIGLHGALLPLLLMPLGLLLAQIFAIDFIRPSFALAFSAGAPWPLTPSGGSTWGGSSMPPWASHGLRGGGGFFPPPFFSRSRGGGVRGAPSARRSCRATPAVRPRRSAARARSSAI